MSKSLQLPDRRSQILEAALAAFLERGYAATTIVDIRKGSGASTGSIYHFFSGKGALAEALLRDATRGWAAASPSALDDTVSPETAIKASVSGLVVWGLSHPSHLRFMVEIRHLAAIDPELAAVRDLLSAGELASATWYARAAAGGAVRTLPWSIAHALILGPAYDFLRLAPRHAPDEAKRLAKLFAEAAWQAVRA
jgi:AcrR family transcriptional regulator